MLNGREQFKLGFLMEASRQGLNLEETHDLVKAALSPEFRAEAAEELQKQANPLKAVPGLGAAMSFGSGAASSAGKSLAEMAIKVPLWAALMAPPGLGAIAGIGLANAKGGLDQVTPEERKQRELIDAYHRAAQQSRLSQSVRQRRDQRNSRAGFGFL